MSAASLAEHFERLRSDYKSPLYTSEPILARDADDAYASSLVLAAQFSDLLTGSSITVWYDEYDNAPRLPAPPPPPPVRVPMPQTPVIPVPLTTSPAPLPRARGALPIDGNDERVCV